MTSTQPFDLDRELRSSTLRILMLIELRSRAAVSRLYQMHAVGSGICFCGADIDDHSGWDNHAPHEMYRDKSWGPL